MWKSCLRKQEKEEEQLTEKEKKEKFAIIEKKAIKIVISRPPTAPLFEKAFSRGGMQGGFFRHAAGFATCE